MVAALKKGSKMLNDKWIRLLWQKFHQLILARSKDRVMFLALSARSIP